MLVGRLLSGFTMHWNSTFLKHEPPQAHTHAIVSTFGFDHLQSKCV